MVDYSVIYSLKKLYRFIFKLCVCACACRRVKMIVEGRGELSPRAKVTEGCMGSGNQTRDL